LQLDQWSGFFIFLIKQPQATGLFHRLLTPSENHVESCQFRYFFFELFRWNLLFKNLHARKCEMSTLQDRFLFKFCLNQVILIAIIPRSLNERNFGKSILININQCDKKLLI
jgi:hypothetical protein